MTEAERNCREEPIAEDWSLNTVVTATFELFFFPSVSWVVQNNKRTFEELHLYLDVRCDWVFLIMGQDGSLWTRLPTSVDICFHGTLGPDLGEYTLIFTQTHEKSMFS